MKGLTPIWRFFEMKNKQVYKWLAKTLCIDDKDCHIGLFDVNTRKDVVRHSLNKVEDLCRW